MSRLQHGFSDGTERKNEVIKKAFPYYYHLILFNIILKNN